MESVVLASLGIWLVTGIAALLCWTKSPLNLFVIALGVNALIGTFCPLIMLWVEPLTWRNLSSYTNELSVYVQLNYLAFAAGLLLAAAIDSTVPPMKASSSLRGDVRGRDLFVSASLVFIGLAAYSLYVSTVGMDVLTDTANRAEKYRVSRGLGPLYIGMNLMIVGCLWAEASQLSREWKWLFRIVATAIVVWAVAFLAVRWYAVALLLGYAYIYCRQHEISISRITLRVFVGLAALVIFAETIALVRGAMATGTEGLAEAIELLKHNPSLLSAAIGGSELAHPFFTFAEAVSNRMDLALGSGPSYMNELLTLVPTFAVGDRPETLAQLFVLHNYPDLEMSGGGTGFTMVGEAWVNFGHILGPAVVGVTYGLGLLAAERNAFKQPDSIVARTLPALAVTIVMAERTTLVITLKQALTLLIPVIALVLTYKLAKYAASRHQSELLPEV